MLSSFIVVVFILLVHSTDSSLDPSIAQEQQESPIKSFSIEHMSVDIEESIPFETSCLSPPVPS